MRQRCKGDFLGGGARIALGSVDLLTVGARPASAASAGLARSVSADQKLAGGGAHHLRSFAVACGMEA
jgi:hypothetical protein